MSDAPDKPDQKPDDAAGVVDELKLYSEIWKGIRETDSISFKLLGLVPFVSGTGSGILASVLHHKVIAPGAVVFLSLLGALVTFGLYRWELRNIQTCSRLLKRAEWLERRFGMSALAGREEAPRLLGLFPVGKKWAETIIYTASAAAWLVPIFACIFWS